MNKSKSDTVKSTSKENTEKPLEPETIQNPNFFFSSGTFLLENNDEYNGGYGCHKSGIIWREGWGVYTTQDGHLYQGKWENDQLLASPETAILYPSDHHYQGGVLNGKYSGHGYYLFDNDLLLESEFLENKPTGTIQLYDYDGHQWEGQAFDTHSIILSVNHFFNSIPIDKGVGKLICPPRKTLSFTSTTRSSEEEDELKERIFKKSNKTINDFRISDTRIKSKPKIIEKTPRGTILFHVETQPKSSHVSITLLRRFLSREHRTRSKPISVYAPTSVQSFPTTEKTSESIPSQKLCY